MNEERGAVDREVQIRSYFSVETDLAGEMRAWPEFVSGQGYSVGLLCSQSGDAVTVRILQDDERPYVSVRGSGGGRLFDKVLGRVIYAMSAHSDDLLVDRVH
jgi:hypothetical protein